MRWNSVFCAIIPKSKVNDSSKAKKKKKRKIKIIFFINQLLHENKHKTKVTGIS